MLVERRYDPSDGNAYTRRELLEFYKHAYTKRCIEHYWNNHCTALIPWSRRWRGSHVRPHWQTSWEGDRRWNSRVLVDASWQRRRHSKLQRTWVRKSCNNVPAAPSYGQLSVSMSTDALEVHERQPSTKSALTRCHRHQDTCVATALPPIPEELLGKLQTGLGTTYPMLSETDVGLLRHPYFRPDLELDSYRRKEQSRKSVAEQKKEMSQPFKEGLARRILAASLPCRLRKLLLDSCAEKCFTFSRADRSAGHGGSHRATVPEPVYRRVCDILHLRGVVAPCLKELTHFSADLWVPAWLDVSVFSGAWMAIMFNVGTRAGPWQVMVTRNDEVIVAWPIVSQTHRRYPNATQRAHRGFQPCGQCYGCVGASMWACLPSTRANYVHVELVPVTSSRVGSRIPTCNACLPELKLWARAVEEFSKDRREEHIFAKLRGLSLGGVCPLCRVDRLPVANALSHGSLEDVILALRPWMEDSSIDLKVSDIKFSQDSISPVFTGEYAGTDLDDTVRELRLGTTKVDDLPVINVVWYHGQYRSLDHRRLWALQHFQMMEPTEDVRVKACLRPMTRKTLAEFSKKYTTTTDGTHMAIANFAGAGTPGMNRTALTSVVTGDLQSSRGVCRSEAASSICLGGHTFLSSRQLIEEVQLVRGNYSGGDPVPEHTFNMLIDLFRYDSHPDVDIRLRDALCITVGCCERFRSPTFWVWNVHGEGGPIGTRPCFKNLASHLVLSPMRNPEMVEFIGDASLRMEGCIVSLGPLFGFICLKEATYALGIPVDTSYMFWCARYDLPRSVTKDSKVSFRPFRWREGHRDAGKFAAIHVTSTDEVDE